MMNTWFKGARTKEAREARKVEVLSARPALKVLSMYCEDRMQEVQKNRDKEEYHSEFQYSMHQARSAGELNALRKLSALLNIDEEQDV